MGRGRRVKEKKKSKIGKIILSFILIIIIGVGSYLGYSIYKNGGGVQGILATMLGQNIQELEDVEPINVLVLRNKWRYTS